MFTTGKNILEKISALPIFPLAGAVLLPGTSLPLNIFEPRYLAMTFDSIGENRLIGMIQPANQQPSDLLHKVGCAGRISSFSETSDNRLEITLTGICRFRIVSELSPYNGYRRVVPDWDDFWGDLVLDQEDDLIEMDTLMDCVRRFVATGQAKGNDEALSKIPPAQLTNLLSVSLPFSPDEKQTLLEAPSVVERAKTLTYITLLSTQNSDTGTTH